VKQLRWGRSTSGVASVEFALILLPFCLLLMGMIDYGWYFFVDLACTNAVRAGARSATTFPGAIAAPCLAAASQQGQTTAKTAINNLIAGAPGIAAYAAAPICSCALDAGGNPQYTCAINANFARLTGFNLAPVPAQIRTSATMR
jgi:Flp pilus assembly protein TadG